MKEMVPEAPPSAQPYTRECYSPNNRQNLIANSGREAIAEAYVLYSILLGNREILQSRPFSEMTGGVRVDLRANPGGLCLRVIFEVCGPEVMTIGLGDYEARLVVAAACVVQVVMRPLKS